MMRCDGLPRVQHTGPTLHRPWDYVCQVLRCMTAAQNGQPKSSQREMIQSSYVMDTLGRETLNFTQL